MGRRGKPFSRRREAVREPQEGAKVRDQSSLTQSGERGRGPGPPPSPGAGVSGGKDGTCASAGDGSV